MGESEESEREEIIILYGWEIGMCPGEEGGNRRKRISNLGKSPLGFVP
jgi:hypothetical protein